MATNKGMSPAALLATIGLSVGVAFAFCGKVMIPNMVLEGDELDAAMNQVCISELATQSPRVIDDSGITIHFTQQAVSECIEERMASHQAMLEGMDHMGNYGTGLALLTGAALGIGYLRSRKAPAPQ